MWQNSRWNNFMVFLVACSATGDSGCRIGHVDSDISAPTFLSVSSCS